MELSNVLNSLGNAHRNRSEFKKALRCYEESLRVRVKSGEELSIANTKNNIGAVLATLEQPARAQAFYADALRRQPYLVVTILMWPRHCLTWGSSMLTATKKALVYNSFKKVCPIFLRT